MLPVLDEAPADTEPPEGRAHTHHAGRCRVAAVPDYREEAHIFASDGCNDGRRLVSDLRIST